MELNDFVNTILGDNAYKDDQQVYIFYFNDPKVKVIICPDRVVLKNMDPYHIDYVEINNTRGIIPYDIPEIELPLNEDTLDAILEQCVNETLFELTTYLEDVFRKYPNKLIEKIIKRLKNIIEWKTLASEWNNEEGEII